MSKAKLRLQIERKRRKMYQAGDEKKRLKLSQELDKLLNEYQRLGVA